MFQRANRHYVKWFSIIEHKLSLLFRLFSPLCAKCFFRTLSEAENQQRSNRQFWCCCLTDNQVHDHWESLDTIQRLEDINWYKKLTANDIAVRKRRTLGNGPCPALGPSGCLIRKCRPATCSTLVCEKMLYVLSKSRILTCRITGPLQVEDIVNVPDILPELCGIKNRKSVTEQDVRHYSDAVTQLRQQLASIPEEKLTSLIEEALEVYFGKGGGKK